MKALVYEAPRQFKYKDVPEPKLEPDDVLVKIDACGLCGTDLHIHEGEFAPSFPLIPGHEFTGEIVNHIFNELRWVRLEDLPNYDFLAADRALIRDLAAGKLL